MSEVANRAVTVFIADDSTAFRRRLAALLAELGYVWLLGHAEDGRQAIAAVGRLRPNVVILDYRMPGGGLEAIRRLKGLPAAPRVIVVTAFLTPQLHRHSLKAGADHVLDKARVSEALPPLLKPELA